MFSEYWKEVAIVLAAAFAILGAIFDVKDERTERITVWGRVFFALTALSMIGGFYAQWEESSSNEQRSRQAQDQMVRLLERSETSLREISRLLQPIERPVVHLALRPDCTDDLYARFCASVRKAAREQVPSVDIKTVVNETVVFIDWTTWPQDQNPGSINILLFKDPQDAEEYLSHCMLVVCKTPDIAFRGLSLRVPNATHPNVTVTYDGEPEVIHVDVALGPQTPQLHGSRMVSVADIPGSTIVVWSWTKLFEKLALKELDIRTPRGQQIAVETWQEIQTQQGKAYWHLFSPVSANRP